MTGFDLTVLGQIGPCHCAVGHCPLPTTTESLFSSSLNIPKVLYQTKDRLLQAMPSIKHVHEQYTKTIKP